MSFDFERIWKSKSALSELLAARPIAEKLRMLDALRERGIALRAAGSQQKVSVQELRQEDMKRLPPSVVSFSVFQRVSFSDFAFVCPLSPLQQLNGEPRKFSGLNVVSFFFSRINDH